MDRYFDRIDHIVQERKTSPRTCFLQDVLDLRKVNINRDYYSTWEKLITLILGNYNQ